MLDPKSSNECIEDSDDEDDNEDDVVEGVCSALVIFLVDIDHPNYEEKDANNYLKFLILYRNNFCYRILPEAQYLTPQESLVQCSTRAFLQPYIENCKLCIFNK